MPVTQEPDFNRLKNKPTTLTGYGITDASRFGVNQSPQNVTGSRAKNTNYTQNGDRPWLLIVQSAMGTNVEISLWINGNQITQDKCSTIYGDTCMVFYVLMPGDVYKITQGAGGTIAYWIEVK